LKVLIHNIILDIQLLPPEICDNILDILSQRWSKMYHPVIEVAYLLDPQFIGRNLEADGMSIISDFIVQYYPNKAEIIYTQILQYKSQTGLFQNQLAWKTVNTVDPITWWRGNFGSSSSELCKMACRILTIPTSSAASERNWSAFSYIHDKKRNRLTSEKVFKLVYI
jgi:hypothetical protein